MRQDRQDKQDEYQLSEEEFTEQMSEQFQDFVSGSETERHLSAMNSFHRRLAHQLATRFGLETRSEGEGRDRHIVIGKTEESKTPEDLEIDESMVWNFGDKEFLVDPLQASVEIYLGKDGTVGAWSSSMNVPTVDRKEVTSGVFKIKQNQIVQIQDPLW